MTHDIDRQRSVRQLWINLPKEERTGKLAVLRFHAWLQSNRPELLSTAPGDSYQHLKSDLRDHIESDQT